MFLYKHKNIHKRTHRHDIIIIYIYILYYYLSGELGVLSKGTHSRTIVADEDSYVAILSLHDIEYIEKEDKVSY